MGRRRLGLGELGSARRLDAPQCPRMLVFDVHSQHTSTALGYPAGFPNGGRGYWIPASAEIRST